MLAKFHIENIVNEAIEFVERILENLPPPALETVFPVLQLKARLKRISDRAFTLRFHKPMK